MLIKRLEDVTTRIEIVLYKSEWPLDEHAEPASDGGDPDRYVNIRGKYVLEYNPQLGDGMASVEVRAEARTVPVVCMEWEM